MRYKEGDVVKVREDLEEGYCINKDMVALRGQYVIIGKVYDNVYLVKESLYSWSEDMFEQEPCYILDITPDYMAGRRAGLTDEETTKKAYEQFNKWRNEMEV